MVSAVRNIGRKRDHSRDMAARVVQGKLFSIRRASREIIGSARFIRKLFGCSVVGYALWSRTAVMELIAHRLKIKLPVRTAGMYLARWGFTPQKPMKKAYEQRPVEVKAWLDNGYPVIAERAKAEGAELHWGDETGLRSDDARGRSFAPKEKTPVVRITSKRENVGLISTVTNQGKVRWMALKGALDADQHIAFLRRLVKEAKRKVFLILDKLRVHHAKLVKAWLAKHPDEIEVFEPGPL